MKYKAKYEKNDKSVLIPSLLTDEHLKIYTEIQLKVILWLLGHSDECFEAGKIATSLRIDEEKVNDAILFWSASGIVCEADELNDEPKRFVPSNTEKPVVDIAPQIPSKPSQSEIIQRVSEQPEIAMLFAEAQTKLGKTVGHDGQCTLLLLIDHYGLPIEVVYMLLDYCSGIGKTNYSYIESVGRDWGTKEIDTIDKAAAQMEKLRTACSQWIKLAKYAGISNPKPTAKQTEYLDCWFNTWHFTQAMVELAYDTMAESTGKLSFNYMNKILQRWYNEGKFTPDSIKEEKKAQSIKSADSKVKSFVADKSASYDINKFNQDSNKPIVYERKGK